MQRLTRWQSDISFTVHCCRFLLGDGGYRTGDLFRLFAIRLDELQKMCCICRVQFLNYIHENQLTLMFQRGVCKDLFLRRRPGVFLFLVDPSFGVIECFGEDVALVI